MKYEYFSGRFEDEKQLKRAFRDLALKYHPDKGGVKEVFQKILNEYNDILERMGQTGQTSFKVETFDDFLASIDPELFKKFQELNSLPIEFELEICGTWLWVKIAKENKDHVKNIGFKWHKTKMLWFWDLPEENKKRFYGKNSMDEIRAKYGSQEFRKQNEKLAG